MISQETSAGTKKSIFKIVLPGYPFNKRLVILILTVMVVRRNIESEGMLEHSVWAGTGALLSSALEEAAALGVHKHFHITAASSCTVLAGAHHMRLSGALSMAYLHPF